jgi:limonene-1,2-epoxide hydrolase
MNVIAQTEPERIVLTFLHSMGPTWEAFVEGYESWLSEDALWENTGFPAVRGRDKCVKFLHVLRDLTGMEYCTIDIHNICSRGDVVLTERTDRMHRADGSIICEFAIMGAFQVRDGQITRYSDYYADSEIKQLVPALASGGRVDA